MKAWIARDKDGALWLYVNEPPFRFYEMWNSNEINFFELARGQFPEVKWEDEEPTEVEITIKPKIK